MKKAYSLILLLMIVLFCVSQSIYYNTYPTLTKSNEYYFGLPISGLDSATQNDFRTGEKLFNHLFSEQDNINYKFNALSCVGCHNTPIPGGSGTYANTFVPFILSSDTTELALQRFYFHEGIVKEIRLPNDFIIRKTPSLFGLGLLEAIDEKIIKSVADPNDLNHDGISGRISYPNRNEAEIGKLGWKGSSSSIKSFIEKAFTKEIGISKQSNIRSLNGYSLDEIIYFITCYLTYLSPPYNLNEVLYGKGPGLQLFNEIGCQKCHLTNATTKSNDKILNGLQISPFTDLLLHDLKNSSVQKSIGTPSKTEYKTPSLWGLNSTGPPYMHDGSTHTLEETILLHNGEAALCKQRFLNLSEYEQGQVISFLKTL